MRDALAEGRGIGGTWWAWRRDQLLAELRRHDTQTAARSFSMQIGGGFDREEITAYVSARELMRQEITDDIDEIERRDVHA